MAIEGIIFLKDHNGERVGLGQSFEIMPVGSAFAGFLDTADGKIQFTDAWETEDLCLAHICDGGLGIDIQIDDL